MSNPVQELLQSKGVAFNNSGKDFLTKCLNPDHNDSNPSFRIDKVTGVSHCFSCGFKTNIFKFYGILTNNVSIKVVKLKDKLRELKESHDGLEPLKGTKPFTKPFRGISSKTLKEFEAFYTDTDSEMEDRIIFPIKDVRNKTTAYVGRHLLSDANPRYLIRPTHAVVGVYPVILADRPNNIVLVEGIFDLLNIYDKGMRNAVCTFGTSKLFNDTAAKLLPYKVMGVEKVFILYDADKAGQEAAAKIKPLIEEAGFLVEIIDLPEGSDPGDLDQDSVDMIIEYTK
jgi:DNA primase